MKTKFSFFIIAILFAFNLSAQKNGGKGTYIWPKYTPLESMGEFENEPAFYVKNIRTLDFTDGNGTQLVVFKRLYINSEEAAEEYNKMEIYMSRDGYISVLAGRTLKKDGEIINLSPDQIIETISREENKYGTRIVRRAQFLHPDVEVGDIIDIAYQIDYSTYLYSDLMYLEDDLPSLESRINIRNSSRLELSVFPLNDMPKMDQTNLNGIPSVSWKKYNVQSLKNDYFNAIPHDHPSFTYMLWRPGVAVDYATIYESDAGNYPNKFSQKSITKYFKAEGIIESTDDPFLELPKILNYFSTEMTWNYDESNQYTAQTFDFLKRKKIDYTLFLRYVMQYLSENKIKYEKGFTKSLLDGKFELGFVSLEQLSKRFLLIYDKSNKPHFLFPPMNDGNFYLIDETPYYTEENQAIVLSGSKGILDQESAIKIPLSEAKINRQRSFISLDIVNSNKQLCQIQRKDVLSGHYSYLSRSGNGKYWLEELGILNTEKELEPKSVGEFYPYKCDFFQTGDSLELISQIDDSLHWLSVTDLLPEGIFSSDELEMELGNYITLPFKKENVISIFLNHSSAISLAEDQNEITYSNEVGSVKTQIVQASPTSLKIEINMAINKRFLRNETAINEFKELMENYATMRQKKWIIAI